eukprot:CAMPEP_0119549104 /NCGR_PEP_ID=MMETSP1352-20130426/2890_1 /TAXON_ID=265584 /ORGANISM="Stauroneis constricta, Strain CCMP1120" /LENGTH=47 /DNA_ID= /DNA_START= /DNA_END= /DNA_ORIENTATION=
MVAPTATDAIDATGISAAASASIRPHISAAAAIAAALRRSSGGWLDL